MTFPGLQPTASGTPLSISKLRRVLILKHSKPVEGERSRTNHTRRYSPSIKSAAEAATDAPDNVLTPSYHNLGLCDFVPLVRVTRKHPKHSTICWMNIDPGIKMGSYKGLIGSTSTLIGRGCATLFLNGNTPGEFYYDRMAGVVYYYPLPNESMDTAKVIAPNSEGLIRIAGNSRSDRVSNISFNGLTFAYSHWSMMKIEDSYADTASQAVSMYTYYAPGQSMHESHYRILRTQGAAIQVDNAENIIYENNVIRHTGAIGIAFGNDVCFSRIDRNVIRDTGSAAISIGDARHAYIDDGDFPVGVEGLCEHISIHKNIMKDLAFQSLQAPGITMIYGRHIDITANYMENTSYTGISLGWGWVNCSSRKCNTPSHSLGYNRVCDNVLVNICNTMHDGAAIYTLAEQPHSEIAGNIVSGVGGFSDSSAVYLDQGSAYFDVHDNTYLGRGGGWLWIWGEEADVNHCHLYHNAATHRIDSSSEGKTDVESRAHESICEFARKI